VSEVRKIPTPSFTSQQVTELAALFLSISEQEAAFLGNSSNNPTNIQNGLQKLVDEGVYRILQIPSEISLIVDDFVNVRLPLDNLPQSRNSVGRNPTQEELVDYAGEIRDELDAFTRGVASYKVDVVLHGDLIECIINVEKGGGDHPITQSSVRKSSVVTSQLYRELWMAAGYQFSQWAYVQRGLRLFDGSRIHIYKPARLINWTRTQAIIDASTVIGQSLSSEVIG
jgi:hypothetical protein